MRRSLFFACVLMFASTIQSLPSFAQHPSDQVIVQYEATGPICAVVPTELHFEPGEDFIGPLTREVTVKNEGTGVLDGMVSTLGGMVSVDPASYSLTAGDSVVLNVTFDVTGCGGEELYDEILLGPECSPVPVWIHDDWFYMLDTPNDTIRFYSNELGVSDTRELFLMNHGCGDPCFYINPQPVYYPEFDATGSGYCPTHGENSITLRYTPADVGNDTIRLHLRDFMSMSGGVIMSAMPVLIGHGPVPILTTRYVDNSGSDLGLGTREDPLRTIQNAINRSSPGDTVAVMAGTYRGPGNRDLDFGGNNIVVRSVAGEPSTCIIDCEGSSADPHFGFWFHSGEDSTSIIDGITITGAEVAAPAFAAVMGGPGDVATAPAGYRGGTATLRNCRVTGNRTSGIVASSSDFTIPTRLFRIEGCEVSDNQGTGVGAGGMGALSGKVSRTKILRNTGWGLDISAWRSETMMTWVDSCVVRGNDDGGIRVYSAYLTIVYIDSLVASGNGGSGIVASDYLEMNRAHVDSNAGNGVSLIGGLDGMVLGASNCTFNDNGGHGLQAEGSVFGFGVGNVTAMGNGDIGILLGLEGDGTYTVRSITSAYNGSHGVAIRSRNPYASGGTVIFKESTVVHNTGNGFDVRTEVPNTLLLENSILAYNLGAAVVDSSVVPGEVSATCSDVYGNSGGNWTGALSGAADINGNLELPPQFCDSGERDFRLASTSLCAAANNSLCGTIGSHAEGCGPALDTCIALQDYDPATGAPIEDRVGDTVIVEGVVYLAPANFSPTSGGYLIDNTGGINFWSNPTVTSLREGDRVQICGPLWHHDGELYIGTYTHAVVDSHVVFSPHRFYISELLGNPDHVGDFVSVTGEIDEIGEASVWLTDGATRLEVLLEPYAGLTTGGLSVGMTVIAQGPCTILNGSMNVKPRRPSDLAVPQTLWANIATPAMADSVATQGVSWTDYDRDGFDDLVVIGSGSLPRIYHNDGGLGFSPIQPGCLGPVAGPGASWGDFDDDGWPDLFVASVGDTAKVLHNNGLGSFECVSLGEVTSGPSHPLPGVWADVDLDGTLDLVLANWGDTGTDQALQVFDGSLGRVDATPPSLSINGRFQAMAWADMDLDGDLDAVFTQEIGSAFALESTPTGYIYHQLGTREGCQGVDVGDLNNDGLPDVFVTHWGNGDELLLNQGGWVFGEPTGAGIEDGGFGQSGIMGDYDNDGWLDVFVSRYNERNVLYHNNGDETFMPILEPSFLHPRNSVGAAHADFDNDGDLDIYVTNAGGPDALYENHSAPADNNWIKIRLVDDSDRVNHMALGARVVVFAGAKMMSRQVSASSGLNSQASPVIHFGLGAAASVDSVHVFWPAITQGTPWLRVGNLSSNTTHDLATGEADVPSAPVMGYTLYDAVPNPFNPTTTIAFEVPKPGRATIEIYDVSGRSIGLLWNGHVAAGRQSVVWQGTDQNGRTVSAGVYFYRLNAGKFVATKRMTLVK